MSYSKVKSESLSTEICICVSENFSFWLENLGVLASSLVALATIHFPPNLDCRFRARFPARALKEFWQLKP